MKKSMPYIEIKELFHGLSEDLIISYSRIRPHNKGEIRKHESKTLSELLKEIEESIQDELILGGDLEIPLSQSQKTLIGHHDGIFWVE